MSDGVFIGYTVLRWAEALQHILLGAWDRKHVVVRREQVECQGAIEVGGRLGEPLVGSSDALCVLQRPPLCRLQDADPRGVTRDEPELDERAQGVCNGV